MEILQNIQVHSVHTLHEALPVLDSIACSMQVSSTKTRVCCTVPQIPSRNVPVAHIRVLLPDKLADLPAGVH